MLVVPRAHKAGGAQAGPGWRGLLLPHAAAAPGGGEKRREKGVTWTESCSFTRGLQGNLAKTTEDSGGEQSLVGTLGTLVPRASAG